MDQYNVMKPIWNKVGRHLEILEKIRFFLKFVKKIYQKIDSDKVSAVEVKTHI